MPVFVAVLSFAACNASAARLQADLTQPGLRARSEAPIPVEVRFQWDGTQILEGRLELELHDGNRILERYRSGDLALTTGEQRFHMLLPPCPAPFSDSQVETRMKFITTAGDVLDLDASSLFIPPRGQRSLTLAWCNARTQMAAPDFERTMLLEHFAPESDETGGRLALTSLVRFAPEDLPTQPLSYTSFDMVVLSADAFGEAGEGQLRALARWVKGGGSVCVFVNGGLQSYHLSFLNELADSVSDAPTFLADNNGYLLPGEKKIRRLRAGLGRGVIVTGTTPATDAPEWREAVAFLWKFRETRAQAVAETAHWETDTNQSGDTPRVTMEEYTAQAQQFRRPYPPVMIPNGTATAAGRLQLETRWIESLDATVRLTDAEKGQVKAVFSNYFNALQQVRTAPISQRRNELLAARQALATNLMGILTPDQFAKYRAMGGPWRPLTTPDLDLIVRDLALTSDQKSKVKAAMDEWNVALKQALAAPTERENKRQAAWQAFDLKLKEIVTPEQYAKFQTGYPSGFALRPPLAGPIRPMQPFNNGMYSRTPSYEVQPSMLASELMAPLLPKTVRLIPFPALLGMLGLFLLAIGPGDYFVLGWFRRRRYTWVLFPALSFGFMLATVLMANHFLGARDQRRSLIIVDLDKDGTALRWNRYDLIFAAADKQAITDVKDALWAPLSVGLMPGMPYPGGMPPAAYPGSLRFRNRNPNLYNSAGYTETETGPPLYEGIVPTHLQTTELIHQWQPRLNRVFSFEPPPVPLLPNWREVEAAWPDLATIRAKLSARKHFAGDVCGISASSNASPHQDTTLFDAESSQILPPSIVSELCLGGSAGLRSVVSQISPNGGAGSEDVPVMDTEAGDSALVILTQTGDDIIMYRRFFHAN